MNEKIIALRLEALTKTRPNNAMEGLYEREDDVAVLEAFARELAGDRGSPTRFKRAAIDRSATPPCSLHRHLDYPRWIEVRVRLVRRVPPRIAHHPRVALHVVKGLVHVSVDPQRRGHRRRDRIGHHGRHAREAHEAGEVAGEARREERAAARIALRCSMSSRS